MKWLLLVIVLQDGKNVITAESFDTQIECEYVRFEIEGALQTLSSQCIREVSI